MYEGDAASQSLGIVIQEVLPGWAVLRMEVRSDMVNGHEICHGGFIFTLADSAFAFACNSHNANTVAAGARIDFLAPAHKGDQLTATAQEIHLRGKTGVYDVVVRNQNDEQIALFRGNSLQIAGSLVEHV
ncbi:MAG: hydroxyphenylacetyl-CoA thioesterase PaaI [Pseudomonadota bacterium]